MDFSGKKVLITGGTTGIGKQCALLLAERGADIIIFGRSSKDLKIAMKEVAAIGVKVYGTTADSSSKVGLTKVFDLVKRKFDTKLDILINCAGLGGGDIYKDYDTSRYLIETNVIGYIAFTGEALGIMEKAKSGHIVNIGSMSAHTTDAGSEVYNASKSAVHGFTESIRKRVNKKGIKVTLIEPGATSTEMTESSKPEQERMKKEYKMLSAHDIANAVLFALSQPPGSDVMLIQIKPRFQEI